jgi:hypothetical protein
VTYTFLYQDKQYKRRSRLRRRRSSQGIFAVASNVPPVTVCIELDDKQWANGGKILSFFQLIDNLGGNISGQRRAEMSARFPKEPKIPTCIVPSLYSFSKDPALERAHRTT